MKNLEIMSVQEMDAKEMRNENGGVGWLAAAAVGALIGVVLTQDLDDLKAAFKKGWDAG